MRKWLVILGIGAGVVWGLDSFLPQDPPESAPAVPASDPAPGPTSPAPPIASATPDSPDPARSSLVLIGSRADLHELAAQADAVCGKDCACLDVAERIARFARSRPLRVATGAEKGTAEVSLKDGEASRGEGALASAADAALEGNVADASGAPIADATVMLLDGAGGRFETRTDATGKFRFDAPSGEYVAVADREGLLPGYAQAKSGAPLHLVMRARRTLTGHVFDGTHVVPNADIELFASGCRRSSKVGADGAFAFEGLAPGSYELKAQVGKRSIERQIELKSEGEARGAIDLQLSR